MANAGSREYSMGDTCLMSWEQAALRPTTDARVVKGTNFNPSKTPRLLTCWIDL